MDNSLPRLRFSRNLVIDILLVLVLVAAAIFRFMGIGWGEYQYLHPDERFLIWVGTDITPLKCTDPSIPIEACPKDMQTWMGFGDYFDTARSTLNPNNRGHGFYVYGTLPVFAARFLVQWIYGQSGFNEMTDVGRPLSALADLGTVLLVFLIASRLYNRRTGLLAAAFSAATVLQIQQAHFFTVDSILLFFTTLAIYSAVWVAKGEWNEDAQPGGTLHAIDPTAEDLQEQTGDPAEINYPAAKISAKDQLSQFIRHPYFGLSLAFGFALGCAVASKLSAAPVAMLLPAAFGLTLLAAPPKEKANRAVRAMFYLALAAVTSILVFRLFQPYAFSGPGFFGIVPNPDWVRQIREQRIQAAGDVDFPPALQWARRPVWFSGINMVVWGLGLPLGVLAWLGCLWTGWQLLADKSKEKSTWHQHALLLGWTGFYFIWQSLAFNPTMRYQLPVYPALAIFAGWLVMQLWDQGSTKINLDITTAKRIHWKQVLALVLGSTVLGATTAWAYAFSNIYVRPITRVDASRWIMQNVPGPINLLIQTETGEVNQPIPYPHGMAITEEAPFATLFTPKQAGLLTGVSLARAVDPAGTASQKTINIEISRIGDPVDSRELKLTSVFNSEEDSRGDPYLMTLDPPLPVEGDVQYQLRIRMITAGKSLVISGSAPANESSWDDGLPLRVDGFDAYGGIYQPGLNFEMYWDDNLEKLQRILTTLDQADFIFISSNRQWGTIPRVPERYPLSSVYYRNLLGCPPEKSVEWCYSVAEVGMFRGSLGFELVKTFDSSPSLGKLRFNTQFAEEAFTVYDHPKVLIFRKSGAYDPVQIRNLLESVDLSQVVHVTPKRAGNYPANLLLPAERWEVLKQDGTWSNLFTSDSLYNRYPFIGAALWYVVLALLGWSVYPILRAVLFTLPDHGYPLARSVGLLLLSYLTWLAGSARLPVTRLLIGLIFILIALISGWIVYRKRSEFRDEIVSRKKYFLAVEGLFLALFLLDLMIRFGNPDLWHPWKGGEKPMDFAYFNAVLKSTSFPPYDPWYAGGYLNYYYYGFIYVGMLVKLIGIVPSVAYNLIIPSIFGMISLGAFSLAWNLVGTAWRFLARRSTTEEPEGWQSSTPGKNFQYGIGIFAALGMAVLGNLGTLRMIFQGYQRLAAPGGVIDGASLLTRWAWALQGMFQVFGGVSLPYGIGDWYWNPSRAIPAPADVEPITEFPFFTVLYADPHAHLYVLPLTLLALSWILSMLFMKADTLKRWAGRALLGLLAGGLVIGVLRPTNTWDFYPYLAIGCVTVFYSIWSSYQDSDVHIPIYSGLPANSQRLIVAAASAVLLVIFAHILFTPYSQWYGQGYSKISLWRGTHTPLSAYFTHWGLFLFVIVSWMFQESLDWMATTPVSALRKLTPFSGLVYFAGFILLVIIGVLSYLGAGIAWIVIFLAAWAGVLIMRPGQPVERRFVLFLIGTGLTLTLMVETIVLVGDIGRMNTVFKFYLQVWTFFAISAAAALGWLWPAISSWQSRGRIIWQTALALLVFSAALFPLLGGAAKIKDRMTDKAPFSLDGMAFMAHAEYGERWGVMDLSRDYRAIRWMQENISGSPVIVEANLRDLYRWGSRFTNYTGLPAVVGWEWHQQQQRALLPGSWVSDRITEIENFYQTTDLQQARRFLSLYDVGYIILGQQERGLYAGVGLDKFPAADGVLWKQVYQDGDTVIYEVLHN